MDNGATPRVPDLPPGLRRVKCNSTISKLVHEGKHFGGAEGELQAQEYVDQRAQQDIAHRDILINPTPTRSP